VKTLSAARFDTEAGLVACNAPNRRDPAPLAPELAHKETLSHTHTHARTWNALSALLSPTAMSNSYDTASAVASPDAVASAALHCTATLVGDVTVAVSAVGGGGGASSVATSLAPDQPEAPAVDNARTRTWYVVVAASRTNCQPQ
jgi:hypothetical protein